jgi:pimeloyl-ACP methyl ester carboxylesterase
MMDVFEESPERLPRVSNYRLLMGVLGDLVLRPWFDWVALNSVAHGYFPLSRAWAAAVASGDSFKRFKAEVPAADLPRAPVVPALMLVESRTEAYEAAARSWEDAFFGAASASAEDLVRAETARHNAAHQWMLTRFAFLPVRRHLPAVRWQVANPDEVEARHGPRLADPAKAFPVPEMPAVEASRPVLSAYGREYWLRYTSPVMGDVAWARVVEPEHVKDPPTVIFLHGIAMETDMWRGSADPMSDLALEGVRVIKPEGPWHARRRLPGWWGGEPAIGFGPRGLIDLFEAWIAELAVLTGWARETSGGPVAHGGVSLGALTSQRAAVAARDWPARLRPDALLLVATSGAMLDVARDGSLASAVNLAPQIEAAGWTVEELARWLPLLEPQAPPALAPDKIIMVLGESDDVTPAAGGLALARRWGLPGENVFAREQGHFSVSLGLLRARAPLERLKEILGVASLSAPAGPRRRSR